MTKPIAEEHRDPWDETVHWGPIPIPTPSQDPSTQTMAAEQVGRARRLLDRLIGRLVALAASGDAHRDIDDPMDNYAGPTCWQLREQVEKQCQVVLDTIELLRDAPEE